jgi:hypothetical protein
VWRQGMNQWINGAGRVRLSGDDDLLRIASKGCWFQFSKNMDCSSMELVRKFLFGYRSFRLWGVTF